MKALLAQTQVALAERQATLAEAEEARRRLESIVSQLNHEKFRAKSEKLHPDQYHLPLEDVEIGQGVLDAAQEKAQRGPFGRHLRFSPAQPRALAGPSAAGGAGHRAREHIVPVRLRRDAQDQRGRQRTAGRDPRAVARAGHAPPELRLPPLLGRGREGPCLKHMVPGGLPTEALIAGSSSPSSAITYVLSAGRDLCSPGHPTGSRHTRQLGRPGLLPSQVVSRAHAQASGWRGPPDHPGRGKVKKVFFWAIASDDRGHSPWCCSTMRQGAAAMLNASFKASADSSCKLTPVRAMTG